MSEEFWESFCDESEDGQHCNCWYDGEECCWCEHPIKLEE